MAKQTHTARILKKLIDGETMISSDVLASNSNQYFVQIKDQGIELVEWFDHEDGRHKKRKLNRTPENIKKAETYLARLRGNADEQR